MTTKAHKLLVDPDIHEPKNISLATVGQVYKADGAGSGTWQTLVIPTGQFNISVAVFPANGTWTKPANCFMIKVTVIGGGGGASGAGGTSSFSTYASATGGAVGAGTSTGGVGSLGDENYSGDANINNSVLFRAQAGLRKGQFGQSGLGDGAVSGGGGGGASIRYVYAVPATAAVTVGAAGAGANGSHPGVVIVEQYVTI